MKKVFLILIISVLLLYPSLSMAYRIPRGDVYPYVMVDKDKFIIYWNNTVNNKSYCATYNIRTKKLSRTEQMDGSGRSKVWDYRDGDIDYLKPFFDTSCMFTSIQMGDNTIVGGIGKNTLEELQLVVFDSKNELVSQKMIGLVGRVWDKPVASNIGMKQENCYIAWNSIRYINEESQIDLVLTQWNVQDGQIVQQLVQENVRGSFPSIGINDGFIALAYYQPDPRIYRFRIVFKVFEAKSLKEVCSKWINYTGNT